MSSVRPMMLNDLARFEMGQSPDAAFVNDEYRGLPFLQGNAEFGTLNPSPVLACTQPKKLCQQGDILISVRAPVGALNKADRVYCIGRGLAAVRFTNALPDFGWHLLNYWARDLRVVAQGSTFEAISKTDLQKLRVLYLAEPQQRRIAEILDTVDAAIQQTEALIAKLKQMKAGLLHDLLTRGLDAHGHLRDPVTHPEQFKDSPLGRIPREWTVCPMEHLLHRVIDYRGKTPPKTTAGVPLITARNVRNGYLDPEPREYIDETIYERWMDRGMPQEGDVLFTTEAPLGNVARMPGYKAAVGQRLLTLCVAPDILDASYLFWLLLSHSSRCRIAQRSTGSTVLGIKQSVFRKIEFPFPLLAEQRLISAVLDAHDKRIRTEEAYRDKLKQLKKGLMADLLTGRVRVSGEEATE